MIAMVKMPYSILVSPSLATGLVKAKLNAAGLNCKAFNLSFLFGSLIGRSKPMQKVYDNIIKSELDICMQDKLLLAIDLPPLRERGDG